MSPAWGCCYTSGMLECSLGFSCSWSHRYHSGKSLAAQCEVSGTRCAQVIPSMYNMCGIMKMVKWSHSLELYPELQGKALQAMKWWYFIPAADLPASTEVERVIYKRCCLHGVRGDRKKIWKMPCVCSLSIIMCRYSQKLAMVTCSRELFQAADNKNVAQATFS